MGGNNRDLSALFGNGIDKADAVEQDIENDIERDTAFGATHHNRAVSIGNLASVPVDAGKEFRHKPYKYSLKWFPRFRYEENDESMEASVKEARTMTLGTDGESVEIKTDRALGNLYHAMELSLEVIKSPDRNAHIIRRKAQVMSSEVVSKQPKARLATK